MRILILTSLAGSDYQYAAGEEVDAPEARALDLIRAGHARALDTTDNEAARREKAVDPAAVTREKRTKK